MLLDHWLIGEDARLDLAWVARRWIRHLATDPQLGRIQPWEELYHSVMAHLAEFLEDNAADPGAVTLPMLSDDAGAVWQRLRAADQQGFDRSLFYLQAALHEYLAQSTTTLARVETFFATLFTRLDGSETLPVPASHSSELLLAVAARRSAPTLTEVAQAVIEAATQGGIWQEAALYWWDRQEEAYRRLQATAQAPLLDPDHGLLLREWGPLQPEPSIQLQLPALHLWQPLLHGRGLLSLSRPARMPVQPSEREAMIRFAAQVELMLIQAADQARSQAQRQQLSRQVVALATTTSEMTLVQEIFRLARETADPDRFGEALLEQLCRVMVAEGGALWLVDTERKRLRRRHVMGAVDGEMSRPLPPQIPAPCLHDSPSGMTGKGRAKGHRLYLPLVAADRWVGTIELVRAAGMSPFSKADLGLAETLRDYVSPLVQIQQLQSRLADQMGLDGLVGLPSAARMQEMLDESLATAGGESLSLILVAVGEAALSGESGAERRLRRLAAALEECLGDADILGRWTDGQFLILLPGRGVLAAGEILAALYKACYRHREGDEANGLTVGLGLATTTAGEADAGRLLAEARTSLDKAMANRDQLRLSQYWEQDDEPSHRS